MKSESLNEHGKYVWDGVCLSDHFDLTMFREVPCPLEEDNQVALHTNIGSFTVVDRMTGYCGGIRDIETGYRDKNGNFWLASGNFDVREMHCETFLDAINCIKKNANTCIPDRDMPTSGEA